MVSSNKYVISYYCCVFNIWSEALAPLVDNVIYLLKKDSWSMIVKGALCGFEEEIQPSNFNINNMNEVLIQTQKCVFFHNWMNKLFSEGNKVPGTLLEARKVAGSATPISQ